MFRHLDYPVDMPVEQLGPAALEALLDRGDLEDWAPVIRALRRDPHGALADRVLGVVRSRHLYGTSPLFEELVARLRRRTLAVTDEGAPG